MTAFLGRPTGPAGPSPSGPAGPRPTPTSPPQPPPRGTQSPARQDLAIAGPVATTGEPAFHDPKPIPPRPRPKPGSWPVMPGTAAIAALINAEIRRSL